MSAPGMSETSRHLRRLTAVRLRASTLCYRYARIEKGDLSIQLKSPYFLGSPYGIRTRVTGVRGRRPRPLDERATQLYLNEFNQFSES